MNTSVNGLGDEALAQAALERVKADLAELESSEFLPINLDIAAGVATVLGVLPEAKALREQIVKELPTFDIASFDKLEDYALALSYAQAKYLSATQPPDDLEPLSNEASKLRERLLAEARAFVHHGVVSEAQLEQLKGAKGYKNIATDLMVLTSLLQAVWPQIQGKTPTTEHDLEHASRVATRLLRIVGMREQGPAQIAEATELRLRAYTLLLVTYDDARRAVTYLRAPFEDADSITPSLHPGRPRRRGADSTTQVSAESVPSTGTQPGAPSQPVSGSPATGAVPAVAVKSAAAAPSSPGSGPFMA